MTIAARILADGQVIATLDPERNPIAKAKGIFEAWNYLYSLEDRMSTKPAVASILAQIQEDFRSFPEKRFEVEIIDRQAFDPVDEWTNAGDTEDTVY